MLTTGTLVSTDATRLGNPSRDKDATLLPRRQPGLASGLDDLGSPPEIEFTKRDRTYRYTPRDEDKPNDDDSENESDDDEKKDDKYDGKDDDDKPHSWNQPSQYTSTTTTSTSIPTIPTSTGTNLRSTLSSSINLGVASPSSPLPTDAKTV